MGVISKQGASEGHIVLGRRGFMTAACGACAAACGSGSVGDAAVDGAISEDATAETGADAGPMCNPDAAAAACASEDGWIEVGPISDYPVGTHKVDPVTNAIVTRDACGIWMMRRTCNHAFASIDPISDGSNRCPNTAGGAALHGAVFDENGVMVLQPGEWRGTARRFNLVNWAMRVCNGVLSVNPSIEVAPGTRAPVP